MSVHVVCHISGLTLLRVSPNNHECTLHVVSIFQCDLGYIPQKTKKASREWLLDEMSIGKAALVGHNL